MNKQPQQKSKTQKLHSVAAAYNKPAVNSKPRISGNPNKSDSCVRVTHREYLSDILGSTAFTATPFAINPALVATFPWLALMASLFESYLFRKLWFVYEPACGSTTQGSVQLAIDFDAADPPPTNKAAIMSYHNAVRVAPWESMAYKATSKDLAKFGIQRFTRAGAVPNTDIKTYDVGNFFIAVSNATGAVPFGELYVEYEVDLYTPQGAIASYVSSGQWLLSGGTGVNVNTPFGSTPINQYTNPSFPITIIVAGNNLLFPVPGQWLVSTVLQGGTTTQSQFQLLTGTGTVQTVSGVNTSGYVAIIGTSVPNTVFQWIIANGTMTASAVRIATYPLPLA